MEPSQQYPSLSSQQPFSSNNNPPNFSELASLSSSSILANQEDFSNSSSQILQQVQQMQQNLKQFSLASAEKEGQELLDAQCQIISAVNQWRQIMFDALKINISELSPALSDDVMAIKQKLSTGEGFPGQVQFVLNQMQAMDFMRLNYKDNTSKVKQFLKKTQTTLNYELASDLINNNSLLQIYFTYESKKYNNQPQTIQNTSEKNNNNNDRSSTNGQSNQAIISQSKNEIPQEKNPQPENVFKSDDEDEGSNFEFEENASNLFMDQSKKNQDVLDSQFLDFALDGNDFLFPTSCCFQEEYSNEIREGISQCFNLLSIA